jgi:hypothetical protein
MKSLRRSAHNGNRVPINLYVPSDYLGVRCESVLPVGIPQRQNRIYAGTLVNFVVAGQGREGDASDLPSLGSPI